MKKTLDTTTITNELKGGSLFFSGGRDRQSSDSPSPKTSSKARTAERANGRTGERANGRTAERVNERTSERPSERTDERPNGRTGERPNAPKKSETPVKRRPVRYSFQSYHDQITRLKQMQAQKMLQGESCHLSDLVRQALDEFLARNDVNERTPERPNGRTNERPNE